MHKPVISGNLAPPEKPNGELPQREVAEYLGHILPELAAMAQNAGMEDSAALIQMAARISTNGRS